jgi:glycyl-tRNA synthetase beta chain
MTKNLLIELFVEELPPKALKKLGDAFAGVLFEQLKAQGLTAADSVLTSFASPRRLAAHVTKVAPEAADKAVSLKLMPVSVGLDASGNATPALLKKLQALGADASVVANLKRVPDGKAEALFYASQVKGATLVEGLQKALLEAITKLPIPKVMTYQLADGWSDVKFVRPVHRLAALHGATILGVTALGLEASNMTEGHRFESAVKAFAIREADSYEAQMLEDGKVIASFDKRKTAIAQQLATAASKVGGGVTAIDDDALLDEVTALVERPNVLICEFEKEFLDVPQECLILTMKANQKYFPLLDVAGKLTHQFLVVSNITPLDASAVIGGNERVVRPRLADAKFFFDQDRKKTLASRVAGLDKVVYHNKLGSQGDRIARVRAIAKAIGQQLGGAALAQKADQAAMLAKTDLVTDMVGEFPELQGTMGRYYALNDGLSLDVADAIEDHYKPRFAGDTLPRNEVGVVVALADKLETLVGMFGIGNLPTGDKDPFALRRHALGVVRMLIEAGLPLQFYDLTRAAFVVFPAGMIDDKSLQLDEFLIERLKGYFKDAGYSAVEVDAAIYSQKLGEWSSIPKRLAAVRAFAALPEAPALAAANKRVSNILKKAENTVQASINHALLVEPAEKELASALTAVSATADMAWAAGDYTANLQALAALKKPVDAFFESVMVNAEDPALKANRLGLLATLHSAMNRVADLSKLAA